MIAKIWKKIGLIILIIACLYNIVFKIVHKVSFNVELSSSAEYIKTIEENKQKNQN